MSRIGITGGGLGLGHGGPRLTGGGVVYLLRDDFLTDAAAPLTSPRTAEPGPGTLTITDTGNRASITGGELIATAGGGQPDPGIWSQAISRTSGLALIASTNQVTSGYDSVGFAVSAGGTDSNAGVYFYGGTLVATEMEPVNLGSYSINTVYQTATVMRSTGAFHFIKGGTFTNWTLFWVHFSYTTTPLYATWQSRNPGGNLKIKYFRVLDLPAPFSSDMGLASASLTGARSVGDTLAHEANGLLYLDSVTVPTAGVVRVATRWQDDDNCWIKEIDSAGNLKLIEKVAGVETTRGTAAGVYSTGHRAGFIFDGTTYRGYSANALRWTYASATNFQTNTVAKILDLGTGGAISGANTWPRQPSGSPAAILDQASA